jgi:hypothetical protein
VLANSSSLALPFFRLFAFVDEGRGRERERKEVIGDIKKKNGEEKKKKKSLYMCADLFGMGGTHGNRKDTGHRKKSLSGFKYT